ncbi:cleft lip and palate transmembrane protein 1-domain-containing protein [Mycotypha africana]|uniref:cleft lip and palate transmembrane protein 1-domain-containing protein n=1 Tax=Mycotypha africana TaxID=64632 RepID=UPI00230182AC|nr:cleft lip and palate transmembrane protein 1-domain-containing protein [Mycotypha africana]KAI8970372.1 cleft lip and palate transmembrane protein 1-domain-containing protein [Mycotypha africana]
MAEDKGSGEPVPDKASSNAGPSQQQNPQQQQQQQQQEKSFMEKYGGAIVRMIFFWLLTKMVIGGFNSSNTVNQNPANTNTETSKPVFVPGAATLRDYAQNIPDDVFYYPPPQLPITDLPENMLPLWPVGTPMEMSIYLSEDEYFTDYSMKADYKTTGLQYNQPFTAREYHLDISTTQSMQHNGTLYAHIFLSNFGAPINPTAEGFNRDLIAYYRHVLTKFYPQKAVVKQKNLLKGSHHAEKVEGESDQNHNEKGELEEEIDNHDINIDTVNGGIRGLGAGLLGNLTRRGPLVAHWQENVTLTLITDKKSMLPKNVLQPSVMKYIQLDHNLARSASGKHGFYKPIIFPNEFWSLQQNAYPINDSVSTLPLNIRIEPISMWKFNIYSTLDDSMKQQANSPMGGMSSSDLDEVKRMFLETNPLLLGTTIAVSLLHSLFEMLAFKNDIAFWKKKQNSAGISVRTLIVNIFFQIVIFLYLLDNNQETSYMVLISQGFGLLIELWKVFKALKYELVWTPGNLLPKLGQQQVDQTAEEDETAKYDAIAFKYLKWLSYPLLGGYAIYSLLYDEHKSWYSYVLKTLVEFVYMFGFITMLPQLYINYRLKSVAHMPWKTLMYKSLNTFIDDLFAFVIKMPTLHRLACLRDDIVFFIYLYQRRIYKVDHTRANEFGQVGDQTAAKEDDKESKKNK